MLLIFLVICVLAMFYWLFQAAYFLWVWRFIPHFDSNLVPILEKLPLLSVIIPACNEEDTIEDALSSLLALSYPNLEIIVINDRSTDRTGEIIEALVKDDSRVLVLHCTELPENWLGKVHALHQGVKRASGEWLLFTDADVHLSEGILEQGISYAQNKSLVHLALLPNMVSEQFIVNCVISTLMRGLLIGLKPWRFKDPSKSEAVGVGGFNLVQRDAFLKTEGFEWLRMEVADDIGVGYLIKKNGGQTEALFAIDSIRVNWYPSLPSLVKGVEKNAFSQLAQFSLWRGLFLSFSFLMVLSSLVIVWWLPPYWSELVWGTFILSALICSVKFSQELKISFIVSFFSFVFGELIMSWVILRSTILGVRRGGLIWRGTVYDSQALKDGTKVKF